MKRMLRSIILVLSLLLVYSGYAEAYELSRTGRLYDYPDMVAADYNGFCQDKDGYMWIGTNRGLLRFDGNNYDLYRHDESVPGSISDDRVLNLLCDKKGRIWVATANGLNLYRPESDSFSVVHPLSLNFNGYILDLTEMPDGTIVFVVPGKGLYVVDESSEELKGIHFLPMLSDKNSISNITNDEEGTIFIGNHSGGVTAVAPNGQERLLHTMPAYITGLEMESDGNILVSSVNEIVRINKTTSEVTKLKIPEEAKVHVNRLSPTQSGITYVGTDGQGLWKIDAGKDHAEYCSDLYSLKVNLSGAKIRAVGESTDGGIWIGCGFQGVVYVPSQSIPFSYRGLKDAYPDFTGAVTALDTWRGNVITGLDKGRLAMYSPSGTLLMTTSIPTGGVITSIETSDDGKALLGVADDGVWELDLNTMKFTHLLSMPESFSKVLTCRISDDEMFVAVDGQGLIRYDRQSGDQKWLPVDPDGDKLTNSYITMMRKSPDQKVWITHYGNVACYDLRADSLVSIPREIFASETAFCIDTDARGDVYIGTSRGLTLFNLKDGVKKNYTTADGLADNNVTGIASDARGGKWIATPRGLSYLPPEGGRLVSYYGGYGLVETDLRDIRYSPESHAVFMSSNLGFTTFMPDSVPSPGFTKAPSVTGVYLNGTRVTEEAPHGDVRVIMGKSHDGVETIRLPYRDNGLSIRLATMDFRDGSNVRYLWKLDKEDEWMSSAPGTSLIYMPRLESGKHKIEIKAMENNVESEVRTIFVEVEHPWYQSTWAKLISLCLLLILGIMFWLLMKKKREEKINDAKIKYFMDLSHDIRSPITLILSPLEKLLRTTHDEETRTTLKTMQRNAQRILSLVNQLLDIRKLEKGKMRLVCRKTDLPVFVEGLVKLFGSQAKDRNLTLTFVGDEPAKSVWIDRDNLDKVLVNLISNAIKYTPSGGSVVVATKSVVDPVAGKCAEISVTDTGIGLGSDAQSKIFQRFYRDREKHQSAVTGTGIGLDLCKRLVLLHHGDITAHNRTDGMKGSVFTIRIPIDRSFYEADELLESPTPVPTPSEDSAPAINVGGVGAPVLMKSPVRERKVARRGRKTVLVVDDDAEILEYLNNCLGKYYNVVTAPDGNEALKIIHDNAPDLVISDVVMPGLDGLELLKQIKKSALTSHIPVILLSTRNAVADRLSGWDRGADGYVGKPFDVDELVGMADNLIDNRLRMKGKFSGAQDTADKLAPNELKGNDEVLMERIMKIINDKIDVPDLNVEKLSEEAGISRAHLNRKMKDMIGLTPSDFIRNIRMQRACELLKKSDIEVTQVAYAVGFTSQPHFSTLFKKFTGYSPSEYHNRNYKPDEEVQGQES